MPIIVISCDKSGKIYKETFIVTEKVSFVKISD